MTEETQPASTQTKPATNNSPKPLSIWQKYWRHVIQPLILAMGVFVALFLYLPSINQSTFFDVGRILIILIAGILPTVIYRYFSQERLPTFYKEYKQNLRRLGLPENAQQYKEKFDAVYGTSTQEIDGSAGVMLFSSPVFVATILSFIGWVLVFYPVPPEATLTPNATHFAYAFLGAYIFGIGSLVRQFVTDDLQPRYYASLTSRFIYVMVLSFMVNLVQQSLNASDEQALLVSFFIGLFPTTGLRLIQRIVTAVIGLAARGFNEPLPLNKLDGLNAYHEDRLLLEGIENVQNLASANIVDLMLRTRFTVEQIIDWIDQALLQIHTRDRFEKFRSSGIRTATDFMDAYEAADLEASQQTIWRQQLATFLGTKLNDQDSSDLTPEQAITLIETIHYALQRDPNLFQIRYWRDHEFEALPEDIDAERTKADLKLMQNLHDEAISAYDELIRRFPNTSNLRLYRGLAQAAKGEYERAIDDYTAVITHSSDESAISQAYLYRGRAQLSLNDYGEAETNFNNAIKQAEQPLPEALMDLAVLQLSYLGTDNAEEFQKAIDNFTEVLKSGLNEPEAYANRGLAYYYHAKATLADPSDHDAYHDQIKLAQKDLERALRLKPSLIPFYINLALILGEWGDLSETAEERAQVLANKEQVLTSAIAQLQAHPDDEYTYRIRLERGYLYTKLARYEEAEIDYKAATQLAPDQATGYFYWGTALKQLGRLKEAEKALTQAINFDPELILAFEQLGDVQMALSMFDQCKSAYVQMLALARINKDTETEARAHLGLGKVLSEQANQEKENGQVAALLSEAERELQTAVNLTGHDQPETYAEALLALGKVQFAQQKFSEAMLNLGNSAILFEVSEQFRASAEAYYYLGHSYMQEKAFDEAEDALQSAQNHLNATFVPNNEKDRKLQDMINSEVAKLATERANGSNNA